MMPFINHQGYTQTFKENKLTLGLFFPLEAYEGSTPIMDLTEQMKLAKQVEAGGFASLFVRDIPLNDPFFGDVGQIYDPWVFLSYVASHTEKIALGTGSVITSFRHPLDVAKSAASLDLISNQRLLFGVATGDRPVEFTAYRKNRSERGELFRESFNVMRAVWSQSHPEIQTDRVNLSGAEFIPKPKEGDIPMLITGHAAQSLEWIAEHGDGWLSFPRNPDEQRKIVESFRLLTDYFKPFAQSLYIDLASDPEEAPSPIHLGFRSGRKYLIAYLTALEAIGVNHVILNVKFSKRPVKEVIAELSEEVVPHFSLIK
ncbi:MAG TPA: LLM class oxidoreductase [Pseudogracilibacillus sp.]|nr:LLM class oxidoreductase [Pseudogracilibacillus sp.]